MSQRPPLWRAFEANEITHSGAHYLLAVASLARSGRPPRAAEVARFLAVSRAAASLQLHSLEDAGLLAVAADGGLHLTAEGAELVARVASKRELLRTFLVEVLGVRESTAELDACKTEHLLSEESGAALVRLTRFLLSGDERAQAFRAAFGELTLDCPPGARCEICAAACLLAGAPS